MTVRQPQRLLEHFVAGTTARAAALLVDVQANTAIRFYQRLRDLIASQLNGYVLSGEVEADERYFGGVRKGWRGRGAGGNVDTAVIPNAKATTLIPLIREHVTPDSIVYRLNSNKGT